MRSTSVTTYSYCYPTGNVSYHIYGNYATFYEHTLNETGIYITDPKLASLYASYFKDKKTLLVPEGEAAKTAEVYISVLQQLCELNVDRSFTLYALGGGSVCDLAGFVASTYMRGIPVVYIPTTLLAMVDAAIGGKTGINFGGYKNIIGTTTQPQQVHLLPDLLKTLPHEEWVNAFAEVIKYGCIADKVIFETLERHNLTFYQNNHNELEEMIITCLKIKNNIALQDVNDKGIRHILNFGHTTGHAIEAEYGLPHGKAVAIGMAIATHISDHVFNHREPLSERVCKLIEQYELPIRYPYNKQAILQKMQMDKKKIRHSIDFVLLRNIGVAERVPLSIENLSDYLTLL